MKPHVRLERPGNSKALGVAVYLLAAPFITLVIVFGLIGIALVIGVALGKKDSEIDAFTDALWWPLIAIVGALVIWKAINEWKERARLAVVIEMDAIEIIRGSTPVRIEFDDVISFRLIPTRLQDACELILNTGRRVRLPLEVAPWEDAAPHLIDSLFDVLQQRFRDRLDAGAEVRPSEPALASLRRILRGLGAWMGACLAGVTLKVFLAKGLLSHGLRLIRSGRIGLMQKFAIVPTGVIRDPDGIGKHIDWANLEIHSNDGAGLVLMTQNGEKIGFSYYATDSWTMASYILECLGAPPPPVAEFPGHNPGAEPMAHAL